VARTRSRIPPTRWRYADISPVLDEGCVWHGSDGLGLCGDGLSHGKVQGAWLSGRLLARQVMHSL